MCGTGGFGHFLQDDSLQIQPFNSPSSFTVILMSDSTRKHLLNLNFQILKTLPVRKLQCQKCCNPVGSDATKITSLLNIATLKALENRCANSLEWKTLYTHHHLFSSLGWKINDTSLQKFLFKDSLCFWQMSTIRMGERKV